MSVKQRVPADLRERDEDQHPSRGVFEPVLILLVFFIGVETGQSSQLFASDTLAMGAVLAMFVAGPRLLARECKRDLYIRIFAVSGGLGFGSIYGMGVGPFLPEVFSLLPLAVLIVLSVIFCYAGLSKFVRIRQVR